MYNLCLWIHVQFVFVYFACVIIVSSVLVAVNADSSVQILAEEACSIEDIDIQVGIIYIT